MWKAEPLFRAVEAIERESGAPQAMSWFAAWPSVSQVKRADWNLDRVAILCGRYDGIDDRVRENLATEELSIETIVERGELPALVLWMPWPMIRASSVTRFGGGDSFRGTPRFSALYAARGVQGLEVPEVRLRASRADKKWRKRRRRVTLMRRPDC